MVEKGPNLGICGHLCTVLSTCYQQDRQLINQALNVHLLSFQSCVNVEYHTCNGTVIDIFREPFWTVYNFGHDVDFDISHLLMGTDCLIICDQGLYGTDRLSKYSFGSDTNSCLILTSEY